MHGVLDPLYVVARRVLLDALQSLGAQRDALVLVGAQAIYVHAGESHLAIAPYTTDGDLAIDPALLHAYPLLEDALASGGFVRQPDVVGIWIRSVDIGGTVHVVPVDLLVPDSLGGPGRRGARIPPHNNFVARKVIGLEATLVDKDQRRITSFEASDERSFTMWVAGPAGLLVAKVHKIADRTETPNRAHNKDALDVYRLLRGVTTTDLVNRLRALRTSEIARSVTDSTVEQLARLFGRPDAPGCVMATRAAGPLDNPETLTASLVALTEDLLRGL